MIQFNLLTLKKAGVRKGLEEGVGSGLDKGVGTDGRSRECTGGRSMRGLEEEF